MAQTPAQKRANEKYAKTIEKRAGKPESSWKKKDQPKSPVNMYILGLLVFVIIIPLVLEPMRMLPNVFDIVRNFLAKIGLMASSSSQ